MDDGVVTQWSVNLAAHHLLRRCRRADNVYTPPDYSGADNAVGSSGGCPADVLLIFRRQPQDYVIALASLNRRTLAPIDLKTDCMNRFPNVSGLIKHRGRSHLRCITT